MAGLSAMPGEAAAGARLFDVFLRSGCLDALPVQTEGRAPAAAGHGLAPGTAPGDAPAAVLAGARVYAAAETFGDLLPEVLAGDAPFVLFAERGLLLGQGTWRLLARLLRNNPGIPGLTLQCDALDRVYAPAASAGSGAVTVAAAAAAAGGLQQRLTPTPHLPSWFAVIQRRLLTSPGGGSEPPASFATLEYFLLDLCRRWAARGVAPLRLGSVELPLDGRAWAARLLRQAGVHLAADYARYRSRHGAAAAPPQLRVEVRGETVPHPGRMDSWQLGAGSPTISLLCPVWKADFLEQMLQSVLAQTWPSWQLLLLIDGPPAAEERRILDVLARVEAEPRIQFRSWPNRGTGICRQALAAQASGDFVMSIDDDDLLPPHALEVLVHAVLQHPGAACVRGGTRLVGLEDRYLPPRRRLVVDGISNDPFEVSQPFLVERGLLAALGGFEGDPALHHAGEDTDLFHKLDRAGVRTLIVDEALYLRRLSHGNLSLGFERQQVLDHFRRLDERFCPAPWRPVERRNQLDDGFQDAAVAYRRDDGAEVVTATRFFQFKTLGSANLAAIDLEVTSACNAVCGFCPREAMPDRRGFIDLGVVQALAAQLAEEPGQRQVVLCGIGESTLHPELPAIVELLARAGARVCMTTNGSRLDVELFHDLVARGLQEINVSLNAATAATHRRVMLLRDFAGIHQRLLAVLDRRHRLHPHVRVHVSFVVCDANQHEVDDFVAEWRPRPVSAIWLHPLNNRAGLLRAAVQPVDITPFAGRYAGDDRVVVDIFKHHAEHANLCKIARSLDFVSFDGELRLCAMDYARQTRYGNVRTDLLRHLHLEKIVSYRRGETLSLCTGCDFHPRPDVQPAAAVP